MEERKETKMETKDAMLGIMSDVQKKYLKSNIIKDRIIILLIVLLFLEPVVFYCGFIWYESQFDVAETESYELNTEGENATIDYDNVSGDQYNDNATHNE